MSGLISQGKARVRVSFTTLGFGLGLALVAVVGALAYGRLSSLDASERWVLHTHELLEHSQTLLIATADAGRARRAFAQTRDEAQVVLYHAARDRATDAQRALRRLTADNPAQRLLLDRIDAVLAARLDQLDAAVRDARVREFSAESEIVLSNAAAALTGSMAELVARFDAEEQRLIDERSAAMHADAESARLTLVIGFAASIVILVLAFLVSRREVSRRNREIAERRAAEASARRANAYLVSAVDSIEDAFAIYDERDRIMLINSTFRHLFGSNLDRPIVGATFEDILDAAIAANVYQLGSRSRDEFRAQRLAYHREPSGTLELRTTSGRILRVFEQRTPERGTVSLHVDITAEVAREDDLRAARVAADAASAAKSDFLSSMSHELRTPLNAILGFAQLLRGDRKEPLGPRHLERLEAIERGGDHLLRLIDGVLDLAKIEAGRVEVSRVPMDVADVVREVVSTLEPMARQADILLAQAPVASGVGTSVVADRVRVLQILMNFGSNALKYGRAGGHVTLEITHSPGRVRVAVVDDGIGIPADKQAKIFEPFQRAGQEAGPIQGTGIGLAISKRLTEAMGGNIGFSSEPGRGSTFWIDLPEYRATTDKVPVRRTWTPHDSSLAADGPRHLLVYVEDNPSNVALMEAVIEEYPRLEMLTAQTAELGIELIRSRRPQVVLMDINLPGVSGVEATRMLAEWPETSAIPVIGLSAAALSSDVARAKVAGFYRFLTKPVKIDELMSVLEEILKSDPERPSAAKSRPA